MPDLNLKKSWNPKSLKNREKVWKREQAVLAQHRRTAQREAILAEKREKGELLKLAEKSSGAGAAEEARQSRTAWIYQGSGKGDDASGGDEDVLLGKRKIVEKAPVKHQTRMEKTIGEDEKETEAEEKLPDLSKDDPMFAFVQKPLGVHKPRPKSGHRHHHHRHHHHHSYKSNDVE